MKKSDLKTGMIVTCRNGKEYVVLRNVECRKSAAFTKDIFVHFDGADSVFTGYEQFDSYNDNLMIADRYEGIEEFDIMMVTLPLTPYSIFDTAKDINKREVLWVREEDANNSKDDPFEFIWGIKSADDLTDSEKANNYTMNDFDVVKDKESGEYIFSVETVFFMDRSTQKKYLQGILDKFTEWMKLQGYRTDYDLSYYEVFSKERADSIEECYAKFKMLVNGFVEG